MRALAALPFAVVLGLALHQEAARTKVELELVYLANEGFLVRAGEHEFLIDAFVYQPYGGYAAVPADMRAAMRAGRSPFDGIELALASHYHGDHFQAAAAAEFLGAHPETRFVSSPQVLDLLLESPGADGLAERVDALLPEASATLETREKATRIELIRLPHSGGERAANVQNLGHVVELGGARILHVGDADGLDPAVDRYDIEKLRIDVALLPYWWLGDAEGVALARKLIGARHIVAMHVPPDELAEVKARLAALDPAILLFERAGESKKLVL